MQWSGSDVQFVFVNIYIKRKSKIFQSVAVLGNPILMCHVKSSGTTHNLTGVFTGGGVLSELNEHFANST